MSPVREHRKHWGVRKKACFFTKTIYTLQSPKTNVTNGWALNKECFTEIMHLFRGTSETIRYRGLVEELVDVTAQSGDASGREKEAVMRMGGVTGGMNSNL
jgi:hypothetical protein